MHMFSAKTPENTKLLILYNSFYHFKQCTWYKMILKNFKAKQNSAIRCSEIHTGKNTQKTEKEAKNSPQTCGWQLPRMGKEEIIQGAPNSNQKKGWFYF